MSPRRTRWLTSPSGCYRNSSLWPQCPPWIGWLMRTNSVRLILAVSMQWIPSRGPPRHDEHSAAEPPPKERGWVRRGPAAAARNPRRHPLESAVSPGGQPAAAGAPRTPPRAGKNPRGARGFRRAGGLRPQHFPVAQAGSLLCRRLATCGCHALFARSEPFAALPAASRRHRRLPVCATSVAAPPLCVHRVAVVLSSFETTEPRLISEPIPAGEFLVFSVFIVSLWSIGIGSTE